MKSLSILVCLVSLIGYTFGSSTHTCEVLNKGNLMTVPPISPSICADILDYPVGIPLGSCQSDVERQLGSLSTMNTLLSDTCKVAVNRALCTMSYPKCIGTNDASMTVQAAPCKSLCSGVLASCNPTDVSILTMTQTMGLFDCNAANWSVDNATCNSGPAKKVVASNTHAPKCVKYSGSVCGNGVPPLVYIPAGLTEQSLELAMEKQQFTFAISSQSSKCDVHQQAWACANTFMECQEAPLAGFTIPLPKLPCKSLCEAYSTTCEPFFSINPGFRAQFQPNCNKSTFGEAKNCAGQVIAPGQPNFPTSSTVFMQSPLLTSTCSTYSSEAEPLVLASAVQSVNAICPFPLVVPDEGVPDYIFRVVDGACAPSCPVNIFSPREFSILDRILVIGCSISIICVLFFIISWIIFKEERKSHFYLYMNLCLLVLYVSLFVNIIRKNMIGADNIASSLCKSNVEEYQFEGYCAVQGALFLFAVLAAVSWWLIQAVDIFRLLVLEIRFPEGSIASRNLKIGYHVFCWLPAAIVVIFTLAKQQFGGFIGGLSWCFMSRGRFDLLGQDDYSLGLFYYPMIIYTCIGVLLMIIVMVRIFLLSRIHENRSKSCWERYMCGTYMRIISYFFVVMVLWVYLFCTRIYGVENMTSFTKGTAEFYTCLLFNQFITGEQCGDVPKTRIPFELMAGLQVCVAFCGLFTFIMHSTTFSIYRSWRNLIYRGLYKINPILAMACCCRINGSAASQYHSTSGSQGGSHTGRYTGDSTAKDTSVSGSFNASSTGNSTRATRKNTLFRGSVAMMSSNRISGSMDSGYVSNSAIEMTAKPTGTKTSVPMTQTQSVLVIAEVPKGPKPPSSPKPDAQTKSSERAPKPSLTESDAQDDAALEQSPVVMRSITSNEVVVSDSSTYLGIEKNPPSISHSRTGSFLSDSSSSRFSTQHFKPWTEDAGVSTTADVRHDDSDEELDMDDDVETGKSSPRFAVHDEDISRSSFSTLQLNEDSQSPQVPETYDPSVDANNRSTPLLAVVEDPEDEFEDRSSGSQVRVTLITEGIALDVEGEEK